MQKRWKVWQGAGITVITMMVSALGSLGVSAQERSEGAIPGPGAPAHPGISRLALGIGAGTVGSAASGFAFRGALSLARSQTRFITIRSTLVEEFVLFSGPAENVWDVGVLYGAQTSGRRGYGSIAAGLSVTGGMRRGALLPSSVDCNDMGWGCVFVAMFTPNEYEEDPFVTVGIPIELEAGLTFSDRFGIGVNGFANLNAQRTSVGASLSFLFGRVR